MQTFTNRFAGFAEFVAAEFFVIDSGDFDVNVDSVQRWTGDSFLVFGNDSRRTPTGFLWVIEPSTLLGHTQNTVDSVVNIFQDLSKMEAEPDGLGFDPVHIQGERIKEDADYEGFRITITVRLGKTRLTIQIDIGFADVITPAPERLDFPTILDFPAPHLYGYPPETVIAEKFQAITVLGMANSCMKDFYDIWMLITNFEFDGMVIQTAIERTFQNRSTELPTEKHIVFSDEFAENKRNQWNSFSRKLRDENAVAINQITAIMQDFFFPVLHASQQGTILKKKWKNKWR